jgi:hypothetical protein
MRARGEADPRLGYGLLVAVTFDGEHPYFGLVLLVLMFHGH